MATVPPDARERSTRLRRDDSAAHRIGRSGRLVFLRHAGRPMAVVLPSINSPTTEPIIHQLRTQQRFGLITEAHRRRAELFIERHCEMFCDSIYMTARQAADVAIGYTAFAI